MGPQSWTLVRRFQKFPLLLTATVAKCIEPAVQKGFCFVRGMSTSGHRLKFGTSPYPYAPRGPTPKKVFPKFLKIVRGQGQNVECARRGTPRGICGKILATVPWLVSPAKKFQNLVENRWFLGFSTKGTSTKHLGYVQGYPYNWAKVHPNRLTAGNFLAKKRKIALAPMVNQETREQSRILRTPRHSACTESRRSAADGQTTTALPVGKPRRHVEFSVATLPNWAQKQQCWKFQNPISPPNGGRFPQNKNFFSGPPGL